MACAHDRATPVSSLLPSVLIGLPLVNRYSSR
jgi:hypothetical protein